MNAPRLGRMQLRIMQVLWERGRATAREVTDALNREEEVAHSTVQTLLRKLEAKGAVAHDVEDRTFYFRALAQPDSVRERATREFIDRFFGSSPGGLVAYLLRNERLDREEIERIRELIDSSDNEEEPR